MLTIKIFSNYNNNEVRKLIFDSSRYVPDYFEELKKEICSLFSISSTDGEIKLSYKDEDGDMISISSQSEFNTMLATRSPPQYGFANSEMSKISLYMLVNRPGTGCAGNDAANPLTAIHANIHCDICKVNPITGLRYICLECPNYDLCSTCFRSGEHEPHTFMVAQKQQQRGWLSNWQWKWEKRAGRMAMREGGGSGHGAWGRRHGGFGRFCNANVGQEAGESSAQPEMESKLVKKWQHGRCRGRAQCMTDNLLKVSGQDAEDAEFVLLNNDPNPSSASKCEPGVCASASAPVAEETTTEQPSESASNSSAQASSKGSKSNAKLAETICQSRVAMLAMGFDDKNNKLTNLLVEHNGDISKCLDAFLKNVKLTENS